MEFYSIEEYILSILMGGLGAFLGMLFIKKLATVPKGKFNFHWSSLIIALIICTAYLYGGLIVDVELPQIVIVALFIFVTISVNITVNTIRLNEVSFIRLVGGAIIFALCITVVNMVDFINELVANRLKINLFLFIGALILAIGNSIAAIRFIRQLRSVNNVNMYWIIFGSIAIGMAFASIRFTLFSSVTIFSNVDLFSNNDIQVLAWAYIDKSLLPLTINILGLVVLELVPGLFGDERNKKQADLIIENRQHYKSLFDNDAVAIFSLNTKGLIQNVNTVAAQMLRLEEIEINKKIHFTQFVANDKREEFKSYFKEVLQGKSRLYESALVTTDHQLVDVQLTLVPTFIKGSISNVNVLVKDITETIEAREKIQYLAYHDPLTSLPNRRYFMDKLESYTKIKDSKFTLMFLDVDRFKVINDVLGHTVGDQLLILLAARLQDIVGNKGTVARMGGDEFTILLIDTYSTDEIEKQTEKIINEIKAPFLIQDQELYVTGSIGIASFPEDGTDKVALMKHADTAMYRAKDKGKNTYEFYCNNNNDLAGDRLALEKDLRKAVINKEFEVYYQPQVNTKTGNTISVEALLRWKHPERGLVSPAQFIPIVEEIGLIHELGEWVMRQSCIQVKKWQQDGYSGLQLSVNISLKQFYNKTFVSSVKSILKETNFNPEFLDIEITESMAMKDIDHAIYIFEQLRELGISISLDDFGKGYSSLNHIKELPITRLKIDGSFIKDVPNDPEAIIIIKTILAMANTLNLTSIAEHVETKEQIDFLKTLNCDEMQGYFFTPPMPAVGVQHWFKDNLVQQ
jgi:diguanylate cyclase